MIETFSESFYKQLTSARIQDLDHQILYGLFINFIFSAVVTTFVPAPYGRFHNSFYIPILSTPCNFKYMYIIQECPSLIVSIQMFYLNLHAITAYKQIFFCFYWMHYINRAIIYPIFRVKKSNPSQLCISVFAFPIQAVNAYVLSRWIICDEFQFMHTNGFTYNLIFWSGILQAIFGFILNLKNDQILINLRDDKKNDDAETISYYIPRGGLFNWCSSGNYFAECVEWLGVLIAFPCRATVIFMLDTMLYLVPRAYANHKFCLCKFGENYPVDRKIIIPYIW